MIEGLNCSYLMELNRLIFTSAAPTTAQVESVATNPNSTHMTIKANPNYEQKSVKLVLSL